MIVTICALIGKRLCLFVKFFHSVFAVGFWFDGVEEIGVGLVSGEG